MKNLGRKPYNLAELGHDHSLIKLSRPDVSQFIKAVDNETGQIIGSARGPFGASLKKKSTR